MPCRNVGSDMSIRQRLYPKPSQERWLVEHCHHARFVYNIGLQQRQMWTRERHTRGTHPEHGDLNAPRITYGSQARQLAQLRAELDWLRAGSSSIQQQALRDLDRAFTDFFAGRANFPTFRRRTSRAGGFYIRDLSVRRLNRKWGEVTVPKVGRVRFRISRLWSEIQSASSARVTHLNGRWHVAFTSPPAAKISPTGNRTVGIDRGVKNTLALSDGTMLNAPSLSEAEQARMLCLQRQLARQQPGSARRERTLDAMAALRRRLSDRRTDWIEQTTTSLARDHEMVAVENLQVRNLIRRPAPKPDPGAPGAYLPNGARAKAGLNRSIQGSLWGRFLTRLEAKMPDDAVVRVDPRNTSRTCASCGHCAPGNRESQAVFECVACGHLAHADTNAAVNILTRALAAAPTSAAGPAVDGRVSPPTGGRAKTRVA